MTKKTKRIGVKDTKRTSTGTKKVAVDDLADPGVRDRVEVVVGGVALERGAHALKVYRAGRAAEQAFGGGVGRRIAGRGHGQNSVPSHSAIEQNERSPITT